MREGRKEGGREGRRKEAGMKEAGEPDVINAAAAKLLQPCPTLCDPTDSSPPGSSVPGILQARTLEWVAISSSSPKCRYSSSPSRVLSLAKSRMKTVGTAKIWTAASGGCLPAPGSSLIAGLNSPSHSLPSVEQMLLTCKCYTENLFCARHVPSAIKKKKKKEEEELDMAFGGLFQFS